jgi:NNP family nitrate/nitrite transporter-like MFS transporter
MGFSKQYTSGFGAGFLFYAAFAVVVCGVLLAVKRTWTTTWVGPWGRARVARGSTFHVPGAAMGTSD